MPARRRLLRNYSSPLPLRRRLPPLPLRRRLLTPTLLTPPLLVK
jgi:hypothetical protein